jgi:hypothetical protein
VAPGQHEAIIERELWEAVQQKLKGQARQRTLATNHTSGSLLAGLLFDETGDRLTPSQAIKEGKRYRYYVSQRLMQARKKDPSGWRLPALELNVAVLSSLLSILEDRNRLHRLLNLQNAGIEVMRTAESNALLLARILAGSASEARAVLMDIVARIDIMAGEMRISFAPGGLHREAPPTRPALTIASDTWRPHTLTRASNGRCNTITDRKHGPKARLSTRSCRMLQRREPSLTSTTIQFALPTTDMFPTCAAAMRAVFRHKQEAVFDNDKRQFSR